MMEPEDREFVSSLALVEGEVGPGTSVWPWAHVMQGARVGADCNVGEHVFIETGAVIGDRVTIKNGAMIWNGVTIRDDCFIGPGVVFTNDRYPSSRRGEFAADSFEPAKTMVEKHASIGAGAVILPVVIGEGSLIGAGSVVTKDVAPHDVVVGNPAVSIVKEW